MGADNTNTAEKPRLLRLFIDFIGFGLTTFGGGWSLIPQMQELYVEKRQNIAQAELLDLTSVARSLPGMVVTNISFLFGYHLRGLAGAFVCLAGIVLPPVLLMLLLACCYDIFCANPQVFAALQGIRAAVVPIILSAALALLKGAFRYPICYAVLALSFLLYSFVGMNCFLIIVIGMLCGLLISWYYFKRSAGEAK